MTSYCILSLISSLLHFPPSPAPSVWLTHFILAYSFHRHHTTSTWVHFSHGCVLVLTPCVVQNQYQPVDMCTCHKLSVSCCYFILCVYVYERERESMLDQGQPTGISWPAHHNHGGMWTLLFVLSPFNLDSGTFFFPLVEYLVCILHDLPVISQAEPHQYSGPIFMFIIMYVN